MATSRKISRPYITYGILALTIFMYLLTELTYWQGTDSFTQVLVRYGAKSDLHIMAGEYWRFITPIFLHTSFQHILFNMLSFYFIGQQLEYLFGHGKFLVFYLLSGVMGNMASFAFNDYISAGASTSIFGMFAAIVVLGRLFPRSPVLASYSRSYLILIGINLFYNIFSPSVDMAGHLGGLLGGVLMTFALIPPSSYGQPKRNQILAWVLYFAIGALLVFIGFR